MLLFFFDSWVLVLELKSLGLEHLSLDNKCAVRISERLPGRNVLTNCLLCLCDTAGFADPSSSVLGGGVGASTWRGVTVRRRPRVDWTEPSHARQHEPVWQSGKTGTAIYVVIVASYSSVLDGSCKSTGLYVYRIFPWEWCSALLFLARIVRVIIEIL